MADLPGAKFLRFWRKTEKGIDLAGREHFNRLQLRVDDETNVSLRVNPDLSRHQRNQCMRQGTDRLHPDRLPFQIADAADFIAAEQFEAADHDAGKQYYRLAILDPADELRGICCREIELAGADAAYDFWRRCLDEADLGKALRAQQFLGY